MSEYKATITKPSTIFIGLDFENRKTRVFPDEVPVVTNYNDLVARILITERNKENPKILPLENIIQNQR